METSVPLNQQKWCGWATGTVSGFHLPCRPPTRPRVLAAGPGAGWPGALGSPCRVPILHKNAVGPALLTPSRTGRRWPVSPQPKPVTLAFQGARPGPRHHTASSRRVPASSSPVSTGGEPEAPEPWGSPSWGGSARSPHQRLCPAAWWRPEHVGQGGFQVGGPYRSPWWAAPGASCGS